MARANRIVTFTLLASLAGADVDAPVLASIYRGASR
jgi:hypothetical protein